MSSPPSPLSIVKVATRSTSFPEASSSSMVIVGEAFGAKTRPCKLGCATIGGSQKKPGVPPRAPSEMSEERRAPVAGPSDGACSVQAARSAAMKIAESKARPLARRGAERRKIAGRGAPRKKIARCGAERRKIAA